MLSRDEILKRTDNGLDVFKHYISCQWHVGRNFLNPLYEDHKASCNVYFDRRSSCYRFKDFGNDSYSGDCFSFVGYMKGLNCNNSGDFVEILKIINRDLSLGFDDSNSSSFVPVPQKNTRIPEIPVSARQPEAPKKVKPHSVVQQSFSAKETAFWQQYGVTAEVLKKYKVSPDFDTGTP
jgi:hypothetical protein